MKQKIINTIVGIGVASVFLWLATKDVSFKDILSHIKAAKIHFVFLAALLYIFSFYARSQKWKLQINSLNYKLSSKNSFNSIAIHYFVNTFSIKLGAVFRSVFMKRKQQIPISISLGTFFSENIFDFLFLFLGIFFSLILNYVSVREVIQNFVSSILQNISSNNLILFIALVILLSSVTLTIIFYEKLISEKNKVRFKNLFFAIKQTFKVKPLWQFVFWQFALWVLLSFMNLFLYLSLFSNIPSFSFIVTITSFIYASWVLPSPGGIGSVEYFSVQAFAIFTLSKNQALSFGFLSNTITLVTSILLGLFIISINKFNIFSNIKSDN